MGSESCVCFPRVEKLTEYESKYSLASVQKNRDNGFSILVLPFERRAGEKNATTNTQKKIASANVTPPARNNISRLDFHLSLNNPCVNFLPLLSRATVKENSKFARTRYFRRIQNDKRKKMEKDKCIYIN